MIVVYLFSQVDVADVKDSFARADLVAFALTILIATFTLFVVDAL